MMHVFAKSLLAAGLFLLPGLAVADMVDLGSSGHSQVRIMRGAPDRCGVAGPVVIHLGDDASRRPVRCAISASERGNGRHSGIQISNFVVVFLADGRGHHYKRHY
jgi:hypothetical protein